MCAIIASFNIHTFNELYQLNSYRGNLTHSIARFTNDHLGNIKHTSLVRAQGEMPPLKEDEGLYYVGHSQAPTTQHSFIHPAVYGKAMLWHNGIIKQKNLSEGTWDTQWLLEQVLDYGWSSLSRIDGTFACIMYNSGELFVFRNEISPMFYDKDMNFSSTKTEYTTSLPPNRVFKINLKYKQITPVAYFETKENPYYIPENA